MKKTFRVVVIFLLLGVLFRGPLYRSISSYEIISYREVPVQQNARLQAIADSLFLVSQDMEGFAINTQSYVADRLAFAASNSGRTAVAIHAGGRANCVGYARLLADLLNRSDGFSAAGYRARPAVAKIRMLGYDVHRLTDNPFFRDHDVVEVVDGEGTVSRVLDPSLFDYTGVRWVE